MQCGQQPAALAWWQQQGQKGFVCCSQAKMSTRLDEVVSEASHTWQTRVGRGQVDKAELLPQVGPRLCQPLLLSAHRLHFPFVATVVLADAAGGVISASAGGCCPYSNSHTLDSYWPFSLDAAAIHTLVAALQIASVQP